MKTDKIIPLLLLLASCQGPDTQTGERSGFTESFNSGVETAPAVRASPESELTLSGRVISDPDKTVTYTPWVSGVAERVHFSLGDRVWRGEPLLELRSQELTALQAERTALESELRVARRELEAARSMSQAGLLSERELLQAESGVAQSAAALEKIEADMALFGSGNGSGVFTIRAPRDGFIVSKRISAGSTVSEGEPLFSIADLSHVIVEANVYAGDLSRVREGMAAEVSAISYPDRVFNGKIDKLSQVFDPEDKALKALIRLSDPENLLKPEMSVVVRVSESGPQTLTGIPADAVIFDDNSYFIVTVNEGGGYEVREISPVSRTRSLTCVESGITEGGRVVVKNHLLIYSQLKGE